MSLGYLDIPEILFLPTTQVIVDTLTEEQKSCPVCWAEMVPIEHERDYAEPEVQGLMYCNKLFEYERRYREKGLSFKQIYTRRLKDEKPVIEAFCHGPTVRILKAATG